jgi:hypothetical protein
MSTKPQSFLRGQTLKRGAMTVIVPTSVWGLRVLSSRNHRSFRHSPHTRAYVVNSANWVCRIRGCQLAEQLLPLRQCQAGLIGRESDSRPLEAANLYRLHVARATFGL